MNYKSGGADWNNNGKRDSFDRYVDMKVSGNHFENQTNKNNSGRVMYCIVKNKSFDTDEQQGNAMLFIARMLLASLYAVTFSFLSVIISGYKLKIIVGIIGFVVIICMIKIDKLPIWEER